MKWRGRGTRLTHVVVVFWLCALSTSSQDGSGPFREGGDELTEIDTTAVEISIAEGDFIPLSPHSEFNPTPGKDPNSPLHPLSPGSPLEGTNDINFKCNGVRQMEEQGRCLGCDVIRCEADADGIFTDVCPPDTSHCGCADADVSRSCTKAACLPGVCTAIALDEPSFDTEWVKGQVHTFRWRLNSKEGELLPPDVPMMMYIDDGFGGPFSVIAFNVTHHDGVFKWESPSDIESNDYRISVQSIEDPTIYAFSYPLTIADPKDPLPAIIGGTVAGVFFIVLAIVTPVIVRRVQKARQLKTETALQQQQSDTEMMTSSSFDSSSHSTLPNQDSSENEKSRESAPASDGSQSLASLSTAAALANGSLQSYGQAVVADTPVRAHVATAVAILPTVATGSAILPAVAAGTTAISAITVDDTVRRPWRCSRCGKRFTQKGNLTVHIKNHSDERRFSCNVCNKRFSKKQNLQSHLITHSKNQPFWCETCGRNFNRKGNLTRHMRIHLALRPYPCPFCGKRFADTSNFHKHMRRHHPDKPKIKPIEALPAVVLNPSAVVASLSSAATGVAEEKNTSADMPLLSGWQTPPNDKLTKSPAITMPLYSNGYHEEGENTPVKLEREWVSVKLEQPIKIEPPSDCISSAFVSRYMLPNDFDEMLNEQLLPFNQEQCDTEMTVEVVGSSYRPPQATNKAALSAAFWEVPKREDKVKAEVEPHDFLSASSVNVPVVHGITTEPVTSSDSKQDSQSSHDRQNAVTYQNFERSWDSASSFPPSSLAPSISAEEFTSKRSSISISAMSAGSNDQNNRRRSISVGSMEVYYYYFSYAVPFFFF